MENREPSFYSNEPWSQLTEYLMDSGQYMTDLLKSLRIHSFYHQIVFALFFGAGFYLFIFLIIYQVYIHVLCNVSQGEGVFLKLLE